MTRQRLEQELAVVAGFDDPRLDLEQYHTPPDLAAHIIHTADLQGDIEDRTVLDLGCGTGMLALGAALRGPERVVGLDIDAEALGTARQNERRVATRTDIAWARGDAARAPFCVEDATVVMNPPFGAQAGNEHADRRFLETAKALASVSYSVHNAGSQAFIEAFAADNGGEVTHAFAATFDLPRQYDHHTDERRELETEVFRIEWA
ncbi:METTL5 family protein [Natronomonas sp. EA1]|uniref:METTL5 family protein n=1 Tax=Natronomonas sp. EA1 TaxID=3421655 RepID=UPI003EBBF08F